MQNVNFLTLQDVRAAMLLMQLYKILFFNLLFLSFAAQAKITIISVTGVSYSEVDTNNNFSIYGGIAGNCTPTDVSSTCNSCVNATAAPASVCNPKSIHADLPIVITFSSDKAINNFKLEVNIDTSTTGSKYEVIDTTVSAAANVSQTVSFNWSKLCENDTMTTCTPGSSATFTPSKKNIYIGLDEDGSGDVSEAETEEIEVQFQFISTSDTDLQSQNFCATQASSAGNGKCGFKIGIGDAKLYLDEIYPTATPTVINNHPEWFGVAMFALETNSVSNIPSSTDLKILKYNASFALEDNVIDGLKNYANYCLLMGNINKAQNIYKFNNLGSSANPANLCASPSEVVGLLSDKSCFISTAAFGSDMAEQVQVLREFRNQFLLKGPIGKLFVKKYYEYSPPIADFIKSSEVLKFIVRIVLYPLIALSWFLIHFGLFSGVVLILAVYFISRKIKKGSFSI